MHALIAMIGALVLLFAALGVLAGRSRRRLKRQEDRSHRLYLRTKRQEWVKRWLGGRDRRPRLSYQPEESEERVVGGDRIELPTRSV